MAIHVRFSGSVAILSGVARLMNDPRHFDAGIEVRELLDQGYRGFVLELGGVRETGATLLGLLMTLTRRIRQDRGEVALANVSPQLERFLAEMNMEDYWDVFRHADDAAEFLARRAFRGDPGG
jgi:anti-anti-sigma regulatory factor